MSKTTSAVLTEDQYKFITDLKWENKTSLSNIVRTMIEYFIKDPEKLKKLLKLIKK